MHVFIGLMHTKAPTPKSENIPNSIKKKPHMDYLYLIKHLNRKRKSNGFFFFFFFFPKNSDGIFGLTE